MLRHQDFLSLVVHAHVIAAAKNLMLENNFETPQSLATAIVEKYIRLPGADGESVVTMCDDGVLLYASEVLSLGLLWFGFHDAIQEGDGDRILNYWKFLLVLFKSTNHPNYAKEVVNLCSSTIINLMKDRKHGYYGADALIQKGNLVVIFLVICIWNI